MFCELSLSRYKSYYYPHGPLARVEIGDLKVQGVDYAYTLQGWLKGINSTLLLPGNDMGRDAAYEVSPNPNAAIGRDVYGLVLGYYGEDDYQAIDDVRWNNSSGQRAFAPVGGSGTLATEQRPLYNGNIAHTVNTLAPFEGYPHDPVAPGQVLGMVYQYDQLNRLKQARGVVGLGTTNTWADVDDDTAEDRYKSEYWYDANGNIDSLARYDANGNHYDAFGYRYQEKDGHRLRNRLYQLLDWADQNDDHANDISDLPYQDTEITDQDDALNTINSANNYGYDALGNLIRDTKEEIETIEWTVAGKVRAVHRTPGSTRQSLGFAYGSSGQRIVKEVQSPTGSPLRREHYIRDAQGNVMATYKYDIGQASFMVSERPIYGSSRLGVDAYELELGGDPPYDELADPMGLLRYELTDHLGNVTAVLTDELLGVDVDADQEYDYFQPHVISAQGYEPFGSLLPGRNYSSDSYRFGFNGMEKDDEVFNATGTNYTTEFRPYDSRLARWKSIDPVIHAFQSPYNSFDNNPISLVDPQGSNAWHPEVDDAGNTYIVADKGDNIQSYMKQYERTEEEANFDLVGHGFLDDWNGNDITREFDSGSKSRAYGPEYAPRRIKIGMATDQQLVDQTLYAIRKANITGSEHFVFSNYFSDSPDAYGYLGGKGKEIKGESKYGTVSIYI